MQKSGDNPPKPIQLSKGNSLQLERVTHRYGGSVAVEDVSLDVRAGELVALLGPSGCGKTTLLRAIGGFISQSEGEIRIAGKPIDHLPPNKRTVGIVFQNYALFPHMTAAANIAYGLEARGTPRAETAARVAEMLSLVKLEDFAAKYPRELSGGQQQRSASRSPVRWRYGRRSCCWTSRLRRWTKTCGSACRSRSSASNGWRGRRR